MRGRPEVATVNAGRAASWRTAAFDVAISLVRDRSLVIDALRIVRLTYRAAGSRNVGIDNQRMAPETGSVGAPPDCHVLEQFGVREPVPIEGGSTGQCFRAGGVVLKPHQDEEAIGWLARLCEEVGSHSEFRLACPIRSRTGGWTVSGWAATTFVEGSHELGRWAEILGAGRALHRAIEHLSKPAFLDTRMDRWAVADRAVWGEVEIEIPDELREQIAALSGMLRAVDVPDQVVHCDLCGNTLFHDELPPAIIDFSEFFRPAEYAEGILISDAAIWESAPMELVKGWMTDEARRQMLIRACLFRLYVAALGRPYIPDRLRVIRDHHVPLTAWLQREPER